VEPGISSRMAAYRRPEVRRLLSRFLEEGHIYASGPDQEVLLELLRNLGMVREAARESWLRDPGTGSTSFSLRPSCPYCGSVEISKEDLMEHTGCGYVGRLSDFMRGDECVICPRCGRPADLRKLGSWFYCRSCGRSFHSPKIVASTGDRKMQVEDLELVEVSRYELNPEMLQEVKAVTSIYSALADRLSSLGFSVEELSAVKGISGVDQPFDIVARSPSRSIYADVILGESEQMLLANMIGQLVKYLDAPRESGLLLILVPRSRLPQQLLGGCCPDRIHVVEGDLLEDVVDAIGDLEI